MPFVVIQGKPDANLSNPGEVYTSIASVMKVWGHRAVISGVHYLVEFEGANPAEEGKPLLGNFKVLAYEELRNYQIKRIKNGGLQAPFPPLAENVAQPAANMVVIESPTSIRQPSFFVQQNPYLNFLKEGFKFLGQVVTSTAKMKEQTELFLQKLYEKMGAKFFELDPKLKVEAILQSRFSDNFVKILMSNWQLSELLLDKIFADFPEQKQEMLATRLKNIYRLNQIRRIAIPDSNVRFNMPIEQQQSITFNFIIRAAQDQQRNSNNLQQPSATNLSNTAVTVRFKAIDTAENDGIDLKIPTELKCPLSMSLFIDPVKVERIQDDKVFIDYFEKSFITQALQQKEQHPLTRQKLTLSDLKEAPEMKERVEAFKQELLTGPLGEKIQEYMKHMSSDANNSSNPVLKK